MRTGGLLAAMLVLAGCDHHAQGQLAVVFFQGRTQVVSTSEGHYQLGPVAGGSSVEQQIILKNLGTSPLTLTSIDALAPGSDAYEVSGFVAGSELKASTLTDFRLVFHAPETAEASVDLPVTFRVRAEAGLEEQEVRLVVSASSVGSQCSVDPLLDFGTLRTGDSRTKAIRIANPSGSDLTAVIGGLGGDDAFSNLPEASFDLAPMQVVERSYTFAPSRAGLFSANVVVKPAADCPATVVTLKGIAVDAWLQWAPQPVEFPGQIPGASSHAPLNFQNFTSQPVTLSHFAITGDFAVTVATLMVPGATAAADGSLTAGQASLDLVFTPSAMGDRVGLLRFDTDAAFVPNGVAALEGIGGAPDVVVTPTLVDLGQVAYFPGAGPQMFAASTVTIANRGTAPLHLGVPGWEVSGNFASDLCAGDFDFTLGCLDRFSAYDPAKGIAPGESVQLPVHLVPSSPAGPLEWDLFIHTDDPDQPVSVVHLTGEEVQLPPCDFAVLPLAADFGLVTSPATRDLAITISNRSTLAGNLCRVAGVALSAASDRGFSLPQGALSGVTLGPGQSLSVPVRFTPAARQDIVDRSGALEFSISSATSPRVSVPLSAAEGQGCIWLSPTQHDYGTVALGCGAQAATFTATNLCGYSVPISGAGFAAPGDFTLASTIPSALTAGQSLDFQLGYHPAATGASAGTFLLTTAEGGIARTRRIELTGNANTTGVEVDVRVQAAAGRADLLFVIDNSGSMGTWTQTIASNLSTFGQYLVASKADVQVAVVTTDMSDPKQSGQFQAWQSNPLVLDTQMPGFVAQLSQNTNVGTNGSGVEEPVQAMLTALRPPLTSGTNAGFLRPNTPLSVISISDFDTPDTPGLLSTLQQANGGAPVIFSAAKPYTSCNQQLASAEAVDLALASASHGVLADFCSANWGVSLEASMNSVTVPPATMPLVELPDLSKGALTVRVAGVNVPRVGLHGETVWTYDAATNSVTFAPYFVPQAGQVVIFTYPTACF